MTSAAVPEASHPAPSWLRRGAALVVVLVAWAALHFGVDAIAFGRSLTRPLVFSGSAGGALAMVLTLLVLPVVCVYGARLVGRRDPADPLIIAGFALLLWAISASYEQGTIDHWFALNNIQPDAPRREPYVPLFFDYVYLAVAFLALAALGAASPHVRPNGVAPAPRVNPVIDYLRGYADPATRSQGVVALLITAVIAALLILLAAGTLAAATHRKQVLFAVAFGFSVGTALALRQTHVKDPRWYWPAPVLVGLVGVVAALFKPDLLLAGDYRRLDLFPAWNLARPLPVEMIGMGVVAALWTLRSAQRAAHRPAHE